MLKLWKEIRSHRELLRLLVGRNLKIRYKKSALGFLWTLLGPVFMIVIYATFLGILRVAIDLPTLVTGILVWQFLAMCLGDSLYAIVGNANLVTKSSFPRIMLPLSMVLSNLVNFLLSFIVLVVYLMVVRAVPGAWYWLPAALVTQTALCLGVALILSCANVFFRDTEHILSVVMLAWFFLTPVIYPVERVIEHFPNRPWLINLCFANPMTGVVSAYRSGLLSSPWPSAGHTALSFVMAWIVLAVGLAIFQRVEPRFGDVL
jgi:ABC-type polysaccharide/polyol phosphate export permease